MQCSCPVVDRYVCLSRPITWSFYMPSGILYTLSPVVPDHGEWLFKCPKRPRACQRIACWGPAGKRCALSLLRDTEGRQARRRWGEERGVEGQGTKQWPLSSREGPSVKCVFLQFQKVDSGQIGVLLSSDGMNYVTEGGGWDEARGVCEGAGTALIDTFSSSERGVKPSVVLNSGIPGQTGCLHSDGQGGGLAMPFVDKIGCWKWIRSDRSAPWAT